MKHKKQNSDKKRFWLGMAGCALVSFTAYAVSYFSSSHIFSNEYNANKNYSVEVYDIANKEEGVDVWYNRYFTINRDIVAKNVGDVPVLLRIKYIRGYWSSQHDKFYWLDYDKYSIYNYLILNAYFCGIVVNDDKFPYNGKKTSGPDPTPDEYDGYYYYQGILDPGESIQHLDKVTQGGYTDRLDEFKTYYYGGIDKEKNEEIWESGSDNGNGKMVMLGMGPSIDKYGIINKKKIYIFRACVETIQATNPDGSALSKEEVESKDSIGLKAYWDALGK